MKRSEINKILKRAVEFLEEMNFKLPPFAFWGPDDWRDKGPEYDEIRDTMLGWDITDFGRGQFSRLGVLLFTIRNGSYMLKKYTKPYAEKILIVEEGQVIPHHYHVSKMEDIINRGGGNLLIEVYNSTENGELAETPVKVSIDGRNFVVDPGAMITLTPGESITLPTGQYHKFFCEEGTGRILLGEVSAVNDDYRDNCFLEEIGRFPEIEEDEDPLYLLCTDMASFM